MIIQGTLNGVDARISLTRTAITASRGDDFVVSWDRGGRLYSVVDGSRTCRRGLNGRVLVKWREAGDRVRKVASSEQAAAVVDRAASFAEELVETVRRGAFGSCDARTAGSTAAAGSGKIAGPDRLPDSRGSTGSPRPELVEGRTFGRPDFVEALDRAARFDSRAAADDVRAFSRVYQPIAILPPDQYLALVLQATEGCSFRTCTFCDFYPGAYRVKSVAQFGAHVSAVRSYLGDSIALRNRAVFLGAANALAVPMPGLIPIFDLVAREFAGRPVHAFLDGFTGTMKNAEDYRALGGRGLHRVYIGLESGDDQLLAFVRKPSTTAQAVATVNAIRAGGVRVAVVVMVGLGGDRFAASHTSATISAVNAMRLGSGDLICFSDMVDLPGSTYPQEARAAGIRPLTADERAGQRRAMEARLVFPGSRPRTATYDVREFVY